MFRNKLINEHIDEINSQFEIAEKIEKKFQGDKEVIVDVYNSAIINMCIRFEAFTSDLYESFSGREPRYNHPWANIRFISKELNIDISNEYKIAHDMWDYYNTLKHVNSKMNIEHLKLNKKYNISNPIKAAVLVRRSLNDLLVKLKK